MKKQLDLINYSYVFGENNLEIGKKNFIYGRNGTGKSSITSAIQEQYSDNYDVCIFDGYEGIFKGNESLNTFSLGKERGEQSQKLSAIDQQITAINNEILPQEDEDETNLFWKFKKAEKKKGKATDEIEELARKSASIIKRLSEPSISKSSYNKNDFKSEIKNKKKLSEEEIKKHKRIIMSEEKEKAEKVVISDIKIEYLIIEVNHILQKSVKPSQMIKELEENTKKRNFARQGMKIHIHKDKAGDTTYDKKCAFCNGYITKERIDKLDLYFSDEIKSIEKRIENALDEIYIHKKSLSEYRTMIAIDDYHESFKTKLSKLNSEISSKSLEAQDIFNTLEEALNQKIKSFFKSVSKIEDIEAISFKKERQQYDEIFQKNNKLIENLELEKEKARDNIRFNKISEMLINNNYDELKNNKMIFEVQFNVLEEEYNTKRQEVKKLNDEKKEIISEIDTEIDVVNRVNNLLEGLGNQAIRLEMVKDNNENKGSYWIKGFDDERRSINKLSEGEKNLIAFLYFIYKLKDINADDKEKIVVFDDPVTSNDATTQYLIIGVLKTFYSQGDCPPFIILTHNQHFFLQVLPSKPRKYKVYHLFKEETGLVKSKQITNSNQLETLYTELWAELAFAYTRDKNTFMWNTMRRILETFTQFYYNQESISSLNQLLSDVDEKSLTTALVKSLHINSHLGLEPDIDIRASTPRELIVSFGLIFETLNSKDHYDVYWKKANKIIREES